MYRLRIFAQNLAIFLSVVIDIGAILAFYLHRSPALREYFPSYSFMPHYILGFALGL
jgi:phosphatidylglycerol lysyltransferase